MPVKILDIRPAMGGDDAALFATELARAYLKYAERKGWRAVFLSELGKTITLRIEGNDVSKIEVEAGTHRVTRIPPNEKNGRRHTSAVTVAVLSPIRLVDSGVNLRDVRIEAYKASGNGGQNRNKRETAIRVVHVPTGISAISAGERFKEVNQERALEVLSARVTAYNERKVTERYNTLKAKMHGSGHIAERQRSYLWREGVAVDHQTGVRVNLKDALNGNLELFTKE